MRYLLYIAVVLVPFWNAAQSEVGYLFEDMPNDSIPKPAINVHTSLKPAIRLPKEGESKASYISVAGLSDLNYMQHDQSMYKTGLGVELKGTIKDKFYFRLAGVQGVSNTNANNNFAPKTYIRDSLGDGLLYTDLRGRISYTPNHIFNFQAGLDHNFIGHGSRSLLLGDYGTPYPFGQIRMRFWRLEYSILYQFMRERDNNRWEGKFMSSHHISFNAAKWLNMGIFEAVVFQPKDTLVNRGFDVEYLNPFVMYRPQEYSLGSPDNVLLGIELSGDIGQHKIYSQFILDEFVLSEIRKRSRWWANKYGGQLGVKGRFQKSGHHFFYRSEFNFVRPYTYAHLSEELNYGNQGYGLAHPYGANFVEALIELKWEHKKFFGKIFTNYFQRSLDKDGYNYGSDIYLSYTNRPYEFDHKIGQGHQFNGTKTILTFGYRILKHGKLSAFLENHIDYTTLDNATRYTAVIGVRSMLWNDHRNY